MSRRKPSRWHGLLPVCKIAGPTSHDIVDMARKTLGERRVGHTGTLDPMAEGLLLLCVGQATRLQQYLLGWDKTYRGLIRLGQATTTYDREGDPVEPCGVPPGLERSDLAELEALFTGEIEQTPPPYSAKKVGGKKLYELARSGAPVEVEPKQVQVHELSLRSEDEGLLGFEVRTSSGFYVRSLAHDIGRHLSCGAHLERLERTRIGPYHVDEALSQEALATTSVDEILAGSAWRPLAQIRLPFATVVLNPGAEDRFVHGQEVVILRGSGEPLAVDQLVSVRGQSEHLLGVGGVHAVLAHGRTVCVRPTMVLGAAARG